jgi:hypothetical protein
MEADVFYCVWFAQAEYVRFSVELSVTFEPYRQALLLGSDEDASGLASPSARGTGIADLPENKTHSQIAAAFHTAAGRA